MIKRSHPWTVFFIVLPLTLLTLGGLEYLRNEAVKRVEAVEVKVQEATKQVTALNAREAKLKASEAERKEMEARLLSLKDGNRYAQSLMTPVTASRATGPQLAVIGFTTSKTGVITTTGLNLSATGTEEQVLGFVRRLEEGRPLVRVNSVSWNITTQRGISGFGTVQLQLSLFGPFEEPAKAKAPAATKKP